MRKNFPLSLWSVLCLGFSLLLLAACSPANPQPALDPTQAVKLLAGEYSTTITEEDVTRLHSFDPDIASNIGSWKITIKSDGSATAVMDQNEPVNLTYGINGKTITLNLKNGSCPENIGRYQWSLNGKELSFQKLGDSCDSEILILTSHPLLRAQE